MSHRFGGFLATVAVVMAALLVAGCGSGASSTAATKSSDPYVRKVERLVRQMEAPQTTWNGPSSGPVAAKGKHLIYLSGQESNSLDAAYGNYLQQAARKIGWTVSIIDGKGTPTGWLAGMDQAVAQRPDAIIIFADATSLRAPIAAATKAGIPVIGLHAAELTGPTDGLFTNIQEDAKLIGQAEGYFVIADSGGHAKTVVVTHNEYGIAKIKSQATEAELRKCSGCTVLSYVNFPAAEASSRMPQLATSWVSNYGTNFYATTVGDNDWDFAVPSLNSGGAPKTVRLVGSDGTAAAYQRIRAGDYEVATVPEPAQEEAYYAIYQTNLALHHQPAATWVPPIYLVTKSNVDAEGGKNNVFDPSNNYQQHFINLLTTGKS
jgi:ribose transport system substrate-binding protein